MKQRLRIVFMGTPDFAVASLKTLIDNNHEVVGVITAPDKPAGRGRKLRLSAVKQYALEQGLHVLVDGKVVARSDNLQKITVDLDAAALPSGCTDSAYEEYDSDAVIDDGSCENLGIAALPADIKMMFRETLNEIIINIPVSGSWEFQIRNTRGTRLHSITGRGAEYLAINKEEFVDGIYIIRLISDSREIRQHIAVH